MTYLSTPLIATGWEQTLVNDNEGNTILLMPNGHKGLDAVKEATALFAAAPDMLAALESARLWVGQYNDVPGHDAASEAMCAVIDAAIAKARGKVA